MNKTVAIVGTHPQTRDLAPFSDLTKDVWIFNNQILQGWCPRANACFDMHHSKDIHRRSEEHPQFKEWLKAEKSGLVYYTCEAMPDIPGNVAYPKDEVVADVLKGFQRGNDPVEYFTSGPCYALALAIHLGYKRIEMYGIEMESDSEYIYQRDGVALYHGIAIGRGIEVVIPKNSMMYYAPLYGYDQDATTVDHEAFEVRISELQQAMNLTETALTAAKTRLDLITQRINTMKAEGASDAEIAKLAPEYQTASQAYEQAIANHAFLNGQYIDCRGWLTRVDKAREYGGSAQAVLAERGEKWERFMDKATLSGQMALPKAEA